MDERIWTDPRDGKEWRVVSRWSGGGVPKGLPADFRLERQANSAPILVFYHPADPQAYEDAYRVVRSAQRLAADFSDRELIELLDVARRGR